MTTGCTSGKRDKCKTWLSSTLLPRGINWELLKKAVYRWKEEHGVRTHKYTQIYGQVVMHHAVHRNGAQGKHAGTYMSMMIFFTRSLLWWSSMFLKLADERPKAKKDRYGTCVDAFGSGVALLVALAAPQLHQMQMELVQDVSVHRVNRIAQLRTHKCPLSQGYIHNCI